MAAVNRIVEFLSTQPGLRRVAAQLRPAASTYTVEAALSGRIANLDDVGAFLSSHVAPMRAPLVLISQAHRSGGTLLSQLLDGHQALAAHPHELKTGHPTDEDWPVVDPSLGADKNFRMLFEKKITTWVRAGYSKSKQDDERRGFFIIPQLQYAIFRELWSRFPPSTQREIFDNYFAAYFGAWLNYQGDLADKRWITAFAPRLVHEERNVEEFFRCYPDGRLIQIIRDPLTWYPSAKKHRSSTRANLTPEQVVDIWLTSAQSMLRNKQRYGTRTYILRFEDLVTKTEPTMRWLAGELGIAFDEILLQPTFNGHMARANSSFAVEELGVISAPLARETTLDDNERSLIGQRCREPYRQVLAATVPISSSGLKADRGVAV